jgi:hypothetical protein
MLNSYRLHEQFPPSMNLPLHLSHDQFFRFKDVEKLMEVLKKEPPTALTAWMDYNKKNVAGQGYLYSEFPEHFTFDNKSKTWHPRRPGAPPTLGRMNTAYAKHKELYYLRTLLLHVPGARHWQDLYTDEEGHIHTSFINCAKARGLATNDKEHEECLAEAAKIETGYQLRKLFTIILSQSPINPWELFEQFRVPLCEDIVHRARGILPEIAEDDERIINAALCQIDGWLQSTPIRLTAEDGFPLLFKDDLFTSETVPNVDVKLVDEEELAAHLASLNQSQSNLFEQIKEKIETGKPAVFHIDAPGGTGWLMKIVRSVVCELGKTYLLNALIDWTRVNKGTPIVTATTGIASIMIHLGWFLVVWVFFVDE